MAPLLHLVPILTVLLLGIGRPGGPPPQDGPATRLPAHAHNDYRDRQPCTAALQLGFGSIEVDVFPVGDRLLVGHDSWALREDRTLESLYLDPLLAWCRDAETATPRLVPEGDHLVLLIDVKRDGGRAFALLEPLLKPLRPWLARVENGRLVEGPIMVVLSGARPMKELAGRTDRLVFVDGRLSDLERRPPVDLVPMISAPYVQTLRTAPLGPPTPEALRRLESIVSQVHAQGRRLRFWGHLDDPRIWTALSEAGVDLIGTDDPPRLAAWLRDRRERDPEPVRPLDSPPSDDA